VAPNKRRRSSPPCASDALAKRQEGASPAWSPSAASTRIRSGGENDALPRRRKPIPARPRARRPLGGRVLACAAASRPRWHRRHRRAAVRGWRSRAGAFGCGREQGRGQADRYTERHLSDLVRGPSSDSGLLLADAPLDRRRMALEVLAVVHSIPVRARVRDRVRDGPKRLQATISANCGLQIALPNKHSDPREPASLQGFHGAERRRSRTYPAWGCQTSPVLKPCSLVIETREAWSVVQRFAPCLRLGVRPCRCWCWYLTNLRRAPRRVGLGPQIRLEQRPPPRAPRLRPLIRQAITVQLASGAATDQSTPRAQSRQLAHESGDPEEPLDFSQLRAGSQSGCRGSRLEQLDYLLVVDLAVSFRAR
jgi:hypothetical protein